MSTSTPRQDLHALAHLSGLQTSYFNIEGKRVLVGDETLLALLKPLGMPVDCSSGCRDLLRQQERQHWERLVDPVIVAWDGRMPRFEVRTSAREVAVPHVEIVREDGTVTVFHTWDIHIDDDPGRRVDGVDFRRLRVNTGEHLPMGYHTLHVSLGGKDASALIISAPRRCHADATPSPRRWGVFAPLYAVRGESDWGAGNYSDLAELGTWARGLGGAFTGTLPLLPCGLDEGTPSPYLPLTRLFWNDFYLDIEAIPFLGECPPATALMQGDSLLSRKSRAAKRAEVDYAEVCGLKTEVLSALWEYFGQGQNAVTAALDDFLRERPEVSDYARFRAEKEEERRGEKGHATSATRLSSAMLRPDFFEFVQWLTEEQVAQCSQRDADLYLDLPVGVHPEGYDASRYADCFLAGATCGAPPDIVFTTGQNWGAPPSHPTTMREQGYEYLRACLAHHMRASHILRLDHIMGLHRMFCIPQGGSPADGTYLRYRHEELYALLSVESHRHPTVVVGENLGTVPNAVPRAMMRHNVNRMFVFYYEMGVLERGLSPHVPRGAMASLNTHDMPTFSATWGSLDIRQQAELGVMAAADVPGALQQRERIKRRLLDLLRLPKGEEVAGPRQVLSSLLTWLGRSPARFAMVNLEDLWMETRQPNIPGVGNRYPSWQHRMTRTLEECMDDTEIAQELQSVAAARLSSKKRGAERR